MGIIDGRQPPAQRTDLAARLVVKLSERHAPTAARSDLRLRAEGRLRAVAGMEFKPYFGATAAVRRRADSHPVLARYVVAEWRDRAAAESAARQLAALDEVDDAYVEAGPYPPPVNAADDPRSGSQGYLDAAPGGLNVRWAWGLTDGSGVGFVDLEQGWTLNHEDLSAAGITLISGVSQDYHGHGTAVLGQVVGVDNTRGVVGMAPGSSARVVSQYRTATSYSTAEAILSAVDVMSAGDVLLLEAQTGFNGYSNVPVEVEGAAFDAIRAAVDAGIIVVEAAGNGGNDLDTVVDTANRRRLDRASADFRDSGAIMVGAGSSAAPHVRLSFSNFGSRIDCYGWGENISTTGDGWTGTSTTAYTDFFGGTSGASPMVAAAALLLQSWSRSARKKSYGPSTMRSLLSDTGTNTASANPAQDRIGVMPDLRAVIEKQQENDRYRVDWDRYMTFVYILFGVLNDAPGLIWVPGKGPVPVDPDWGPGRMNFTGAKRDLLIGMAMQELAEMMDDRDSARRVAKAATEAMQQAVRRIGAR